MRRSRSCVERGIKVSVIIPGLVDTALIPNNKRLDRDADAVAARRRGGGAANRQVAGARVPGRRSMLHPQLTIRSGRHSRCPSRLTIRRSVHRGRAGTRRRDRARTVRGGGRSAAHGIPFPFPRIFDRTVMVTLLVAMLFCGARLESRLACCAAASSIRRARICARDSRLRRRDGRDRDAVRTRIRSRRRRRRRSRSGRGADPEVFPLGDRDRIHRGRHSSAHFCSAGCDATSATESR